jgi:dTMP kinase
MAEQAAPFIPSSPEETGLPPAFWRVFGTRSFFKLWVAQVVSSLGDWIGIIAILAIAARISGGSGAAVSLVMVARVVPGFFLGTVGGVIVDRFDRRRVLVACDIGRGALLALLPFVDNLLGLVLVSFALEILSLLWGPAKEASIPNLVDTKQLTSANSLGLFAAFGTFPLASLAFALLAYAAAGLSSFGAFSSFNVDREFLALWVDGLTFLVSAMIIWRLPIPRAYDRKGERVDWTATLRDISEGVRFIRQNRLVRGVIIGIGVGLIGGGAMIPLGPVFADQVLGGGSAAFGLLMTTLGFGAAIGVVSLLIFQKRLSRETVFQFAVMATGVSLVAAASVSSTAIAVLLVGLVGAFAGSSYVTGFTVLQENVRDELRGRTFAALYTVIRMCLLISLTISPLWADGWDRVSSALFTDQAIEIGGYTYALPGVRFALWGGGLITFFAGFVSWRAVRRARRRNEDRVAAAAVSQAED